MFKTVFSRMLVMFLIVVVGSLTVLGVVLIGVFRAQFLDDRKKSLLRESAEINTIVAEKYYYKEKRPAALEEMKIIARQYGASIWVMDRSGGSMTVVDKQSVQEWEGQSQAGSIDEYLTEVLNGYEISTSGFFGDYFDEEVLTVGRPLVIGPESESKIEGAIFMHVKLGEVVNATNRMIANIVSSIALAALLALILVTLTARRISHPLVQINRVMRSYGKGDFSVRAQVKGRDEVAQLAQGVNAMADELDNLEVMRKRFVSNVSHELKSPIASMRGFVQGMLDGTVASEQREEILSIVLEETNRLNNLINDLLDLAKIESGNFPMQIAPFDINELVRRTLISFETQIDQKKLDVRVHFSQEYGCVLADRDRIAQVLRNLLDNAIKFSRVGGILTVRTSFSRHTAYVGIRDSGVGITKEHLEHIWERFYTAEEAHTPGESGTGLGLSIVKRILDQHSSHIRVSSTPGQGTLFVFTLACAPAERKTEILAKTKT